VWLVEGLIFYLEPATVHRLLDDITRLAAPGSELLIDTIGQSLLDSPHTQAHIPDHGLRGGSPSAQGGDPGNAQMNRRMLRMPKARQ
jgi:O-methyltransferase involved in polyketide biosynthesis